MQESFGEYKVLERVGAGSKAEVFRARDTRAGRTAAIKVLTSDVATDPVRGQPIADEAFLAKTLGHPNVATLYDVGEQDGRPHLVYEFVQGQTLKALLGGHPINPRRALEFATQVADALAEAHAIGLVHRALRTDKVLVSQKGTAKITDFGLGLYATAVAYELANSGAPVPAMAYWAPEQRTGEVDPRSDIYALGLILVEMLTGRPPEHGDMLLDLSVSPLVAPLVRRMLEADPSRRIDSAATVAAQLRELVVALDTQRTAPPVAPAPPPRLKNAKRSSRGVVVSKPAPPAAAPVKQTATASSSSGGTTAQSAASSAEPPHRAAKGGRVTGRELPATGGGTAILPAYAPMTWVIAAAIAVVAGLLWFLLRGI